MIRNYLVVALRNLARNKSFTIINVVGLSIGITCCIVIYLIIKYDYTFDQFHSQYNQIYKVVRDSKNASGVEHSDVTPYPFAKAFRNDFSDIPLVTQFHVEEQTLVMAGSEKQMIDNVIFGDSLFFSVFDFEVIEGNPKKDLGEPGKVFLTESAAQRLFKQGKRTTIKLKNVLEAEVAGIVKDPPPNSHIQFSMIVSMPSLSDEFIGLEVDQWGLNSAGYSYVVLPENVSKGDVENRLSAFVTKYYDEDERNQVYRLLPLKDFHFDLAYNGNAVSKSQLLMLGLLGLFILSVASVNFINLATALAVKKSKEIGIRKTLGAIRSQLTAYFLGETFVITIIAVLVSLCIIEWTLPLINNFIGKQLDSSPLTNSGLLLFILMLTITITLFAGIYPGLVLSSFSPVAVLKNKITGHSTSGSHVRKGLVVFQFMIAQALIIGTLVVSDQMNYFHNKPLGFAKEAVINVEMPDHKRQTMQAFEAKLTSNPDIKKISYSLGAPVADNNFGTDFWLSDGPKDQKFDVTLKLADHRYGDVYGLALVAGRWMTEAEEKLAEEPLKWEERKYTFVINETGAKQLGFTNPSDILGKRVTIGLNDIEAEVIGVVKDFHINSLHQEISPVIILNFPYFYFDAGLKVDADNLPQTIRFIETAWNEINPDYYFEYTFLDDHIASLYKQEQRTFAMFKIFTGLSIFIGCLGLYGLISFMANQRLKEVGIRKVMGASVSAIVMLFSKEFIRLILIAFVVAAPISGYLMHDWLEGFAYRIDIHWSVFVIGILSTLVIALGTVSYRAIRAALVNPVETLRSE